MDETTFQMFKGELEKQCRFALMAHDNLIEILKHVLQTKRAEDIKREDVERMWSSIHSFLVAAGNISKIFWPPNSKYSDRGDALRKNLSIGNDSPFSPSYRKARNYLEHFDEYLEKWIKLGRDRFVDSSFGSLDLIKAKEDKVELRDFLRYFDYKTFSLIFSGDLYDLKPIINSVANLLEKVRR